MKTLVRGNLVYDKDNGIIGTAIGEYIKKG